jgi:hypothetical protein
MTDTAATVLRGLDARHSEHVAKGHAQHLASVFIFNDDAATEAELPCENLVAHHRQCGDFGAFVRVGQAGQIGALGIAPEFAALIQMEEVQCHGTT